MNDFTAGADSFARVPNPAPYEKTARPDSQSCDQEPAGRKDVRQPVVGSVHITPQLLSALEAACKLLPREHRLELESLRVALLCQRMRKEHA